MKEPTAKPSGEYINGFIKLTAKARVWRKVNLGYKLVIGGKEFVERFKELRGDAKSVLIEVDTPVAKFTYRTYGDIKRGKGYVCVVFHCVRDLDETWKDLYWFGDFTVNVYIPVQSRNNKQNTGTGDGNARE